MSTSTAEFEHRTFFNSFVDSLPGEQLSGNHSRQVPRLLYSRVAPTPVRDPRLIAWSDNLSQVLGLDRPPERGAAVDALSGNLVLPSMRPFAARYGGHQFGGWAGQLGDGRAMSLGELSARDGSPWEIQLKGAGPTPYSRRGDGRAVLRSSLREFLCSEAMYHLGVPTTRALSLVGTGDTVIRDMFYMGDPKPEPGAIVCRVAPTFVRFGNFELLTNMGEIDNLRSLADYVLKRSYPELGTPSPEVYAAWFEEVCRRTAVMIAHWMTVGFVHGVMNTDNMSILGVTIDYGPYGWLEPYDPGWTPNTTDFREHRYAYGRQPSIALWNLMMLGEALSPLFENGEATDRGLEIYRETLAETYGRLISTKLGINLEGDDDEKLLGALFPALYESEMDMTIFFRRLSHLAHSILSNSSSLEKTTGELISAASYISDVSAPHERMRAWLGEYGRRLTTESGNSDEVRRTMLAANPKYVLRNYLAQNAIDEVEEGNLSYFENLFRVLKTPFDEHPEDEVLAGKRPEWARDKPGCATLSCSS